MSRRTFLIGLDGATFDVLDPLMAAGAMPFLAGFVAGGVRATLRSTTPALTPPAWTSLITGRSPGAHGVFNFFGAVAAGDPHVRLTTSDDIGVPTVWDMVDAAGLRSTLLNYPLTFPAPQIAGYVVPGGWMPWRQLRLGCHPATLYDELRALPGFDPRMLAMDASHEARALEGCPPDEIGAWVDLHTRREQHWLQLLCYLDERDPSDFTAIVFDGVDKLQHLCWPWIDPAAPPPAERWAQQVWASCRAYFRSLDGVIATIVERAGPEAAVIIASDHGFGPQVRTFFVNAWLRQQGLLAWAAGEDRRASSPTTLGLDQAARHVYQLDWARTRAYCALPGGNGIHVVREEMDEAAYDALCDELAAGLLAVRDPHGAQVVTAVHRRASIFPGPYGALAPDLTLELSDGGLVSIVDADQAVVMRPQATGAHRPEGVLIAGGPLFRPGAQVRPHSILEVAPLLIYALGLPAPVDLERPLPADLLHDPPAYVPQAAATPIAARQAPVALSAAEERRVMERLRALGYVE